MLNADYVDYIKMAHDSGFIDNNEPVNDSSDKNQQHAPENDLNIKCLTLESFLAKEYKPRTNLLAPWLPNPGLAQIHAWRGVGKTQVALRVAYAVASGGEFLGWKAEAAQPVLYIDGEMPAAAMQERLAQIIKSSDKEPPPGYFNLINLDEQGVNGIPDLATVEGQALFEEHIKNVKLIIVDNISTLCRNGAENKSDDWMPVQQWALRMRSEGRTVLFIHHAGKNGQQRGTSKREDVLDTVISLTRPADYESKQGARFVVNFEKARGIMGDAVEPIEVQLIMQPDGRESWSVLTLEESTYDKVVSMINDGMSQSDIASELGLNKSSVSRHVKKARANGEITVKERSNA